MDFLSYRKTALIPAIKSVIEQGKIVFYEPTHKNNPWGTALIAAKVKLDGKEYYMGVAVRHLAHDNTRYYIHDAILVETEKGTTPIKNAGGNAGSARSDNPSIFSILLSIRKYNTQFAENKQDISAFKYSPRTPADTLTIREYLGEMKPTARMNETEKLLLKRYHSKIEKSASIMGADF